jgi:anti-sigma factor RsiW
MHLHGQTLERYVTGDLPANQLGTLDEHISNCILCAAAFAREGAAAERWERRGLLGRLVRVEAEHAAPSLADDFEARAA